jgi:hypothetical protein
MLTPQQALCFLSHPDSGVRYHAANYFADLTDSPPPETAGYFWKAIDQFGDNVNAIGVSEREHFISVLKNLPQDEQSVGRAVTLLQNLPDDVSMKRHLFQLLVNLPLNFIDQHLEQIVAGLDAEHRQKLEHRLAMRSMSLEQIWNDLVAQDKATETVSDGGRVDMHSATHTVMALAEHAEQAIPRAMATLEALTVFDEETQIEPDNGYFLRVWCVQLLGLLRYVPAIDLILEAMIDDDGDFLRPIATIALSRMDPQTVIPKLVDSYNVSKLRLGNDQENDGSDEVLFDAMDIAEALGKMKHPLAESALIQLLEKEEEPGLISSLCLALCDLCTTQGLETLRKVVVDDSYDPGFSDVQVDLIMLSKMVDYHPPELQAWEKEIRSPGYGKRQWTKSSQPGLTKETTEMMLRYLEGDQSGSARKGPLQTAYATAPQQTIRRETPKIGRNDPCPCGSGKKYKKCCGK